MFGRVAINGAPVELVGGLNLKSPLTATVNPATGMVDLSVTYDAAGEVPYDNGGSGLMATDVQAALDELAAAVADLDADLGALDLEGVLNVGNNAGGNWITGLAGVSVTTDHPTSTALLLASSGTGSASSAWSIGSATPTHLPAVGSHFVRVSADSSGLYVKHASSWVPYLRGPVSAARVPYMADNTGRVTTSSNLVFDGTNLSIAAPTANAHAVNRGYIPSGTTAASTSSPTNVTDVTATWLWVRVGDFVTATLRVTSTNTSTSTPKSFEATLPFAPVDGTWGSALRVGGGVSNAGHTVEIAGVQGQARVLVQNQQDTNGSATRTWAATFVYQAEPA